MLTANVAFIPTDSIALKRFINIGNTNYHFDGIANANANTTLADAFTFTSFSTYPISSVLVINGGGGITKIPTVDAVSTYEQDDTNPGFLKNLGILAPIQIISAGEGYEVDDKIVFTGGNGLGAYANVTSVSVDGEILNVEYVQGSGAFPIGGMGYSKNILPTLTVDSANTSANGAVLVVPTVLGEGAEFSVVVDRAGSITTINLLDPGEDYISTPIVSLKVQDIIVQNVSVLYLPRKGDVVYQGNNAETGSYVATVDSITLLLPNNDPTLSQYVLRVFNSGRDCRTA
jgi:hypothetical protein